MRILLIDTCSDVGIVALAEESTIKASVELAARSASKTLLTELRSLLKRVEWNLHDLEAIGVASGPGSFTGLRVGLACAKGLCEALSIPLAAVSRLDVLGRSAKLKDGYAVLNAGRAEVYVRDVLRASEQLQSLDSFLMEGAGSSVVIAEEALLPALEEFNVNLRTIGAQDLLPLVLDRLREGQDDRGTADANYVRGEQDIYRRSVAPGV